MSKESTSSGDDTYRLLYDNSEDQFSHFLTDTVVPPDGKYAWFLCADIFTINFIVLGLLYASAVFLLPISEDLGVGRGEISLVFSASNGLVFFLGIVGGTLSDRFGVRWVVFAGGCIAGIGLTASAFCVSVWQLLIAFSLVLGFGLSLIYIPSASTLGQWFSKYRGLGTGLAVSGSGVGTLVSPLVCNYLENTLGWRTTFVILAEVLTVTLLLCSIPLKRRTPTVKKGEFGEVKKHLKSRTFILLCISSFFNSFAYFIPFGHLVSYAQDFGVDEDRATMVLSFMGVASIFGRILIGYLSDKWSRRRILQFSILVMSVSSYLWYFATDFVSILAFAFVYGFIAGSVVSVITPLVADYFGIATLGTMTSFTMMVTGLGNVIGSPVAGFIYDHTGSYTIGIMLCGSAFLISFFLLLLLPAPPPPPPVEKLPS